jgi:hypothetical protein
MKTSKELAAELTAANIDLDALVKSFKVVSVSVDTDSDEDGPYTYATGTAVATVLGATVLFTVSDNGEAEVDPDGEHGEGIEDGPEFEAWLANVVDSGLADDVAEYLSLVADIDEDLSNAKYDYADDAAYRADPYRYNGVNRHDFY